MKIFSYSDIGLKLFIGLVTVIIQINLLGKGNLAPANAVDQIQNYVLGGIIGGMIYNSDITALEFFLILVIWTLIVMVIKFGSNHNRYLRRLVNGEPHTIVRDGRILVAVATRFGLSAGDLSLKLRTAGVTDVSLVKRAVLEQNGQLTVTLVGADSVKYPVILDTVIDQDILELIDKDEDWVAAILAQQGYELADVYYAVYRGGSLVVAPYPGHETVKK
ncbi:DUF421 domain-containing protein [Loigolactobacillus backii]|uniref:Uncharacterized protein n=1 Tax=Loigolactobacillus backii TaxID=375175 RepID=A0A192H531_9LACO|nr:hypothetical protein AYR52_11475 [Loigolactobacillus backii]ANK63490.1 hypothetical protein AYR53_01840 [Loigolactobacillus backii]ANK65957.1 hypothetical protein AYR54_11270 [Loigolactobacillus backii]ANK68421.1 hypothetical protein AYR55_11420 [Loigolactobacillus backii]ANK70888.1 hypothetical protein AYR56_02870 [Loigolactobacillus backii]